MVLDTENPENLMEWLQSMEKIASIRAQMMQARGNAPPNEPVTEAESERSHAVMQKIVEGTEHLGLYQ